MSNYDVTASLLLALLVLIGFAVTVLFLVWLTSVWKFKKEPPEVAVITLNPSGQHAMGVARDIEEPGVEELADVAEPQIADTLEAVTDAVSSIAGAMQAFEGNAEMMGTGNGLGDSRASGPGGDGDGGPAFYERWQIKFTTNSIETYAQQLDHFGIELGLIGGNKPEVEYASQLANGKPTTRVAPDASGEKRIRFNYGQGVMRNLDLSLMNKAGFNTRNRVPLHFWRGGEIQKLRLLELQHASPRPENEIAKTIFGVRGEPGAFEFYIVDQTYK